MLKKCYKEILRCYIAQLGKQSAIVYQRELSPSKTSGAKEQEVHPGPKTDSSGLHLLAAPMAIM